MLPQLQLIPGAVSEILVSAADTGYLTLADRYGLLAATLDETLADEERRTVNRILRSALRGRIEVSDRLSVAP